MVRRLFTVWSSMWLALCVVMLGLLVLSYCGPLRPYLIWGGINGSDRHKLTFYNGIFAFETERLLSTPTFSGSNYVEFIGNGFNHTGVHFNRWKLTPEPAFKNARVVGFGSEFWISLWWPLVVAVPLALPAAIRLATAHRRRTPGHCERCGYDLRASTERCPECGRAITTGAQA